MLFFFFFVKETLSGKTRSRSCRVSVVDFVYFKLAYSGIRIKSTPRDRKKLLTLSKVDFIQFQGRKPKFY